MQQWFGKLKRQEQLLVVFGVAFVIVYLIYSLMWKPMVASSDVLKRQNEVAQADLAEVTSLAAKYNQLKKSSSKKSGGAGQSLTRVIDETVKKNELAMKRFQPSSSGDVQVRFENAVFNNMMAWLNQLEIEHGVAVKDLSVSPGSGSGLVNVSVRLRKGS